VYAKMMARQSDTGAAMDELVRGPHWALLGTSSLDEAEPLSVEKMPEAGKPLA